MVKYICSNCWLKQEGLEPVEYSQSSYLNKRLPLCRDCGKPAVLIDTNVQPIS